jgi:hypothetical protein
MMSSNAFSIEVQSFPNAVRLNTLGGGDTFGSAFWDDSEQIYSWPGELSNYADMATFSFVPGGPGNGFSLNKDEETFGNYFVGLQRGSIGDLEESDQESNNFTLGYGYPMEGLNLGILYNRQSVSYKDTEETSWSANQIGAGIDFDLNEDTNIDAAFNFIMLNGKDAGDDQKLGNSFSIAARMMYGMRDNLKLVPVVAFMSEEYTKDMPNTFFGAGLGFAYTINDDNTLVFGVDFQRYQQEDNVSDPNTKITATTLPGAILSVEHEFNDWIEARVGASKAWDKIDYGDNEETTFPFVFNLGAGLNVGDWTIDLMLNEASFYNFGYWLHGNPSYVAPIAAIQAKLFF